MKETDGMKIQELKENSPIQVVEVFQHEQVPPAFTKDPLNPVILEHKVIQTIVVTDGKIASESDETLEKINEFYINDEKYQYKVDTLKSKTLFLKNYSYVIKYLIAREWIKVGRVVGYFDVIKDISLYLENLEDKKALKNAKNIMSKIECSKEITTVSDWALSQAMPQKGIAEKLSNNVYSLKKVRK